MSVQTPLAFFNERQLFLSSYKSYKKLVHHMCLNTFGAINWSLQQPWPGHLCFAFCRIETYYTRNCNLYYTPPCRTNIRNFSIRFQGPKFFNSLSPEIQNSESIRLFGNRLKKFLLSLSNILFVELPTSSFLSFSFFYF